MVVLISVWPNTCLISSSVKSLCERWFDMVCLGECPVIICFNPKLFETLIKALLWRHLALCIKYSSFSLKYFRFFIDSLKSWKSKVGKINCSGKEDNVLENDLINSFSMVFLISFKCMMNTRLYQCIFSKFNLFFYLAELKLFNT